MILLLNIKEKSLRFPAFLKLAFNTVMFLLLLVAFGGTEEIFAKVGY